MSAPADWARVKKVLEHALECHPAERDAYLDEACENDATLRASVERLLVAQQGLGTFLETPAAILLDDTPRQENLAGRVVGSYQLSSRLGAGGMGEVYLAHDAKLDRPVALKFVSPEFAASGERLRRFHLEARAASRLNHPHIVVVHDFGELDGRPFIVTEYVEGETLRQRLAHGPLPTRDVVEIGTQIASALGAAHARGLIHRDIKPDNVMVRPDGYVKVLDFGLAKLTGQELDVAGQGSAMHTETGVVVGTTRYMSPEQARGQELDVRTDIWSLGVVLYEMAAGQRPFKDATAADTIADILGKDPVPLETIAPHTPPALCALISKSLRKNRDERHVDAGDLLSELRNLRLTLTSSESTAAAREREVDDEPALSTAGERRRVTVLVSVVANYGSLLERLAASEVDFVIGRIRAAAVDTMRRHGGVVNQSIGEEIVSLFGIPVAHEDDDLRAVRAALELHARVDEIGREREHDSGIRLQLQSGVHAGTAVVQRLREGPRRYAVTGAPVQAAARLAAAAEPDAVWVSSDCDRRLAPFIRTEPRPPITLQADTPPLTPHCVLGESGLESRLDASEPGGLTPYAGRASELHAVEACVRKARAGEGQFLVVSGDPGAGKSRLIHEARAQLAGSEFRVLQGRCRLYGGVTSYLPFVEAMRAALGVKEQDIRPPDVAQTVARIRAVEPSLEPFVPLYLHVLSMPTDVFPVPRHLRGEHLRAALLEAITAFFSSYAQRAPAVLLLEDWHWADDASREALRHLSQVVAAYPLLILVTTRPEPRNALDALEQTARITLGPLDFSASEAIAKAVLGVRHLPDGLARRLHDRTGGNPFFLEEMCQALREAGVVTAQGAEAVTSGSPDALQLPDSVQAVIRSRLDRLHPDDREALRVASVIGREFSRRILSDVVTGVDLATAITRLKDVGIIQQIRVVPDPAYRFKHVLTQEVAYESLLEHQRRTLHHAVGQAIRAYHAGSFEEPLEALSYHFSCAEDWREAVEYGLRAATRATELSQFGDALTLLEQVRSWLMRLPDEPPRREQIADVLLRQERLCERLGMRGRQVQLSGELIELLAPHGATVRLAEAYLRQGDVSTLLKRFDAADRALATSLRMSRDCGDAALERSALRSIGLLRWHQGRHDEAIAITENALAIDRERDDELAVAGDLSNLGNILKSMGQHQRALAILDEALTMPVVQNDPIKRAYIVHNVASVHRALGNIDRALDYLQDADESARAHMLPIQRSFHLTSIAHIHLQEGRLEDSLRIYREAVELSRRARHADGLAQSLRMLGEVLFTLRRDREALEHLQEAAELFAQIEDHEAEAAMRHHTAMALERLLEPQALDAWTHVLRLAKTTGDTRAELDAVDGVARTTRRLAPAKAIGCFDDALRLAARLGERQREATLHNTLGVLHWEHGAYGDALGHYEAALALIREQRDRVHEGLTLNSIGVTLTKLRRYEEARTALDEACAVNRQTGERLLEAHSWGALGEVALTLGRFDAAVDAFTTALSLRRALADRRGEAWMLHHLTRTHTLMGDDAAAAFFAASAAEIAAECEDVALRRACGLTETSRSVEALTDRE